MAEHKLIAPDGKITELPPANGKNYSLKELQAAVGGYIEIVRLGETEHPAGGQVLVVNEEGKIHGLPINSAATRLWWGKVPSAYNVDFICGPALFCDYALMLGEGEDL